MAKTGQITDRLAAYGFALAGNAVFTVVSTKTGKRFTFKVQKAKPREGELDIAPTPWFVKFRNGPESNQYQYLGMINPDAVVFHTTRATKVGNDAPVLKAWEWVWHVLKGGEGFDKMEFWHEGRCGKCGRALTVPESISTGLGPVCAGRTPWVSKDTKLPHGQMDPMTMSLSRFD